MPVYTYQCTSEECQYNFSLIRRMAARKEGATCPLCGQPAIFRVSVPGVFQRGPQWHARMMDHDAGKPGRDG